MCSLCIAPKETYIYSTNWHRAHTSHSQKLNTRHNHTMRPSRLIIPARPRAAEHKCDAALAGGRARVPRLVDHAGPIDSMLEAPVVRSRACRPKEDAAVLERHHGLKPRLALTARVLLPPEKHRVADRVGRHVRVFDLRTCVEGCWHGSRRSRARVWRAAGTGRGGRGRHARGRSRRANCPPCRHPRPCRSAVR